MRSQSTIFSLFNAAVVFDRWADAERADAIKATETLIESDGREKESWLQRWKFVEVTDKKNRRTRGGTESCWREDDCPCTLTWNTMLVVVRDIHPTCDCSSWFGARLPATRKHGAMERITGTRDQGPFLCLYHPLVPLWGPVSPAERDRESVLAPNYHNNTQARWESGEKCARSSDTRLSKYFMPLRAERVESFPEIQAEDKAC